MQEVCNITQFVSNVANIVVRKLNRHEARLVCHYFQPLKMQQDDANKTRVGKYHEYQPSM